MAQTTSDSLLGVIRKFELMLTRRAVNMLGGGLRSPSAFLLITGDGRGIIASYTLWVFSYSLKRTEMKIRPYSVK